jgi:ABC-2 type transport system permease protein
MSRLRPALAFTEVVWRIIGRDRTALFFMLILPVAVMVIIGTTFGGQERAQVGLVRLDDGPLTVRVATALERADGIEVEVFDDVEAMRRAVRRQAVVAGVVLPAGTDARLRRGRPAEVGFIADRTSQAALSAQIAVSGILDATQTPIAAAQLVTAELGGDLDGNLALADAADAGAGPPVRVEDVGEARRGDLSRFSLTAPQNLVLFVFINAMAGAVLIVIARRDGILRRTLATRTPIGVVLLGLALGWLALALAQSVLIVTVGALLFGVRWGDPLAAGLLVLSFALVGCGAGLLVGAIGRNEDRVGAVAPVIGIVLGALGGCMVPLEVFPGAMVSVAHAVPHFWAIRAWQQLVFDGDGVAAIAPSLAVLWAFGTAFIALATVLLRRQLTDGS